MEKSSAGSTPPAVLLTGGSGYLGGLIAAILIKETDARLVLPIRSQHTRESILAHIQSFLPADALDPKRIVDVPLPPLSEWDALIPRLRGLGVEEIVHCAACLDYFDVKTLTEVNIELTQAFLELGKELKVRRFVYLSTAFSCGYAKGVVLERLNPSPPSDPTQYTRTKREAEAIVAKSGLPFLILRPSIVVGNSRHGAYRGKPFGIYQLAWACERLLTDHYAPELHVVAPKTKLHLIHEDAFQSGFLGAYRHLPDGAIVHLVSKQETLPTARSLLEYWVEKVFRPQDVYYYDKMEDVPLSAIDRRQRIALEFTSVNLQIATHEWVFDRTQLLRLVDRGVEFIDATQETLDICQAWYLKQSAHFQNYLKRFGSLGSPRLKVVEASSSKKQADQETLLEVASF